MALDEEVQQQEVTDDSSSEYGFQNPDAAGAPDLDDVDLLNNYWDGNLSLAEAQVLNILGK